MPCCHARSIIVPQFSTIERHFVRKGCAGPVKIAVLPQIFAIEPRFPAKGLSRHTQKRNFTSVFAIEPRFVRKGCRGTLKIATSPQFLAIEARFVRTGCVSYRLVGTAGISKASSRLRGTSRKRYSQAFARRAKELLMRATPPLPKPLPAHRRRSFRE